MATFNTEQLHPLRLLSSLTGDRSRAAAATAAAHIVSPVVPESCIFIPNNNSCTAEQQQQQQQAAAGPSRRSRPGHSSNSSSSSPASLLLLVSFRNGDVAMYHVDMLSLLLLQPQQQARLPSAADSTEAAAAAVGQQQLRVLSHLRLPGPPAKLQLLPDNCHISSSSAMQESLQESLHVLAVSEGLWLLQISQQSHQMKLRHIAAAPAVLASALSLPQHAPRNSSSSCGDAGQQQQQRHVACVLPSGQLQLLSLPHLQQHQQHRMQTWLPGVAVHELLPYTGPQQQLLLAQCSGNNAPNPHIGPAHMQQQRRQREVSWLQCLDAASGAHLAAYQPSGSQMIASTGMWDAAADALSSCAGPRSAASSSPEQQQQQQQGLPGLHNSAASSNRPAAAGTGTGAAADPAFQLATLLRGLDSPGGSAARSRSQQMAAGSGQTWSNLKRAGPLVVLGTRASDLQDDCKGQVIVLQLLSQQHTPAAAAAAAAAGVAASSSSSYSFQRVARLRMPEPVTAVCGFSPELLLVAVGNVLAAYRTPPEQQQQQQRGQLQQVGYCFVRAPILSLSVGEASSGLVLAADMMQGITAYQIEVHPETGQVGITAVAAHDDVRPTAQVACLPPLPGLSTCSAAAAAAAADAAAKKPTGNSSSSRGAASNGLSELDVARAAAVARAHGLCLDSRGFVVEVSWAKQRTVPVKCLQTLACIPLDSSAASMQVLPVAAGSGSGTTGSSSSSAADWFCRSLYALLDNEDIQLHWQNPLAAGSAAAAAACSNAADGPHAGAAAAGSAVAAAGVAASSAVVASRSGAVLHLQKLPAQEGRLLLHLQQLLLQHPLTRGLCIGAEHVLHEQQQLAGNNQAVPARLGAVDGRVLQQMLLLPGELQQLLLRSAALGQCLPGRLAQALRVSELQQAGIDAVLCRLQVLPCWE
jgi:hypothetical protein